MIWVSRLQNEIALSTVESEYSALSQAMRDLVPARSLLKEIVERAGIQGSDTSLMKSTVFEDNNGALANATTPKISPRTKHIAVKVHWFKQHLGADKGITIQKIDSEFQKADIFTKGLPEVDFARIRKLVMGW